MVQTSDMTLSGGPYFLKLDLSEILVPSDRVLSEDLIPAPRVLSSRPGPLRYSPAIWIIPMFKVLSGGPCYLKLGSVRWAWFSQVQWCQCCRVLQVSRGVFSASEKGRHELLLSITGLFLTQVRRLHLCMLPIASPALFSLFLTCSLPSLLLHCLLLIYLLLIFLCSLSLSSEMQGP